jgi:serine/threonine protein kinase
MRQDGTTVLPASTDAAEDFTWGRDRFITEGQTLASLHHAPAIVRVFDFLEANGTAYIVMELLSGVTLEDHLSKGRPLSPAEVDKILWPILDGLEQVHGAGSLHRDIKPANILLDAAGRPTLIDFGASRAAMVGRTTAMTAIFTPGYAAAEQFSLGKQGPGPTFTASPPRFIAPSLARRRPALSTAWSMTNTNRSARCSRPVLRVGY